CANKTEIRGEAGKEGIFYAALGSYGRYKMIFSGKENEQKLTLIRLSREGEAVYRVGLGLLTPGSNYLYSDKALYICGKIEGIYGFFRSFDDGKSWEKINNDIQQFGDINSIDGDCRVFGRYYIATGSFGLKCGEPE
ncbi:MAG: endoglucanase, partial [Lachnospiraceae bacterium]|nr:endoglucanase [Lachnospiraceae bacterium]